MRVTDNLSLSWQIVPDRQIGLLTAERNKALDTLGGQAKKLTMGDE